MPKKEGFWDENFNGINSPSRHNFPPAEYNIGKNWLPGVIGEKKLYTDRIGPDFGGRSRCLDPWTGRHVWRNVPCGALRAESGRRYGNGGKSHAGRQAGN